MIIDTLNDKIINCTFDGKELLFIKVPNDLYDYYINQFGITGKSFTVLTGPTRYIPNICFDNPENYTILSKLSKLKEDKHPFVDNEEKWNSFLEENNISKNKEWLILEKIIK
jgi:hypothetical protein